MEIFSFMKPHYWNAFWLFIAIIVAAGLLTWNEDRYAGGADDENQID